MTLRLDDLSKSFGAVSAVESVDLELSGSGTLALLGPSGCGKSTLLRLIAGLEQPDRGRVLFDGRDVTQLPPQKRDMGIVFQDYALFPHLNVAGNVGFSLVEGRRSPARIKSRVGELLELVGLLGLERRKVFELSGGQQQRVALARALAAEPSLLLLDEPLSNLDPELRGALQVELHDLLSGLAVRALYVTHDQAEAFAVAPRVALMRSGRILQDGPSAEVLAWPGNAWAARFLGYRNVFSADNRPVRSDHDGALLLRDDLIGMTRPVAGSLIGHISRIERISHRLRLTLAIADWGGDLIWEGYERELPAGISVGDELGLDVPDAAWVKLEPE
ncbi:MAG: ABC transporter ATP-binding protein [Trueperaceae bacterium]